MTAEDESSLRTAARLARLGGWSVDVAAMKLAWSGETAAIHDEPPGFTPDLMQAFAYFAPEFRDSLRRLFEECIRTGAPFSLDFQLITTKGRRVWVRTFGESVKDDSGKVVKVQGGFQEVGAQRAAADRILSLVSSLEGITDAFVTLDRGLRFTYLNGAAEKMLQRPRSQLLGQYIWQEFKEAEGTTTDRAYRKVLEHGVAVTFEQFYPPLNKWLDAKAYPTVDGVAVYFRDVTELHAVQESIREQATLLDQANDAIIVRDLEHRVLYWNRSAERIYGWTAAEAKGRKVTQMQMLDLAAFEVGMRAVMARGEWVGELVQTRRDGERLTAECRWTLVRDDDGNPKSVLAINTDITASKKLESQILRSQRMESIGSLAGGIAHDLNNTLAPILMTVSLMRSMETDGARSEDLETIEVCSQRAADMVAQLLAFARGVDGKRAKLRVGAIATELQKIIRDTFPKDISLQLSTPINEWDVHADPTQIHQLLMNLCVNARDAMPNGGLLTLAVDQVVLDDAYAGMNLEAKPGPYVLIRVEDSGVGMPASVLDRIFDPLFTTKELGKGTGLGLSTAHSIVRSHGGFIHVYSEQGRGTRFRVYLPADVGHAVSEQAAIEQSAVPRGNGETVLVVDDEESIRHVAQRTLERFGYQVRVAKNGAEAVSIYASHRDEIAVVLTDMSMPVMDGPATIVALRSMNPKVKIIGTSGLNANGNLAKAVGAGVHHFVPKPYTAETLLKVLKKILKEG